MESLELETEVMNGQKATHTTNGEAAADKNIKVEVLKTEKQFEDLAKQWQNLADRTGATIFMTHEWAFAWWKNFGRHKRRSLSIITFWEDDTLVGLAPFYKGSSSIGGMEIEKRLQIIGSGGSPNEQLGFMDDYGISDFLDILVDEKYIDKISDMLYNIISANSLNVDRVTFHQTRNDSFIMQHLYPKLQESTLNMDLEHTDTCPYINLDGQSSLKGYIKSVKSSARRRFRQSIRSLVPKGDLVLEELETWPEVEEATNTMIKLHQDRWNRIGFPGVFWDERFTNFFKEIVEDSYNKGRLWFKQIKDEEGVCAARLLLKYNGRYYDYISGFDERRPSAKYRPGIGLLVQAVSDAIEEDAKTVELLRGQEGYKYDFTKKDFKNWKINIDLSDKNNKTKKSFSKLTGAVAQLYKRVTREARLVNVQRKENGVLKMFPEYFSFRWQSIKMKMDD